MPCKKMTSLTFTYLTYRKVEKKVPELAQCKAPKTKLKISPLPKLLINCLKIFELVWLRNLNDLPFFG